MQGQFLYKYLFYKPTIYRINSCELRKNPAIQYINSPHIWDYPSMSFVHEFLFHHFGMDVLKKQMLNSFKLIKKKSAYPVGSTVLGMNPIVDEE